MDRLTATHNARQAGQRARIKAFDARLNAQRVADARALMARLNKVEDQLREVCRRRGVSFDALTRDARTADAKALDAARKHLTGKAPRTADESNHLAALNAKNGQSVAQIQAINEANAQRGIKGMLQKLLASM